MGVFCSKIIRKLLGRDLGSFQNLLKKHQLLEADVLANGEQIKELNSTADQFINNNIQF
jgi:hypothetical protein